MRMLLPVIFAAVVLGLAPGLGAAAEEPANPYAGWKRGLPKGEEFFPVAVWLQAPRYARKFQAAGINLFVGLWKGPTEAQLKELAAAKMPVICHQNEVGLKDESGIIVAWMHGDEPDNAQSRGRGKGYGPPVKPSKIVADYRQIARRDPTRPVMLNLGQGVAWDGWHGRGVRTNHPEDYPEYVKGCDIASFDIYPAVHSKPEVAGKLWYVPKGVDRLRKWTGGRKIVWNCIECTRISNVNVKPTPAQVRSEVWMALIHGSQGLIYFVHQFKPRFIEAGLLADKQMTAAVTKINRRIHELAPVLNSPTVERGCTVSLEDKAVPVDVMVKRHKGAVYVFAVAMRPGKTKAVFSVRDLPRGARSVEVIGEDRRLRIGLGRFEDEFADYGVHLYRIGE